MLRRIWGNWSSQSFLVGLPKGTVTLEDKFAVSYRVNIVLPRDSVIILLGTYPNELKTYVHTKTCTQMFIAASFIE